MFSAVHKRRVVGKIPESVSNIYLKKKRHLGIFVFKDSKMGISGCMLHACTWDVKGATTPQLPKLSGNHRTSKYMISDTAQFWMCQS